MRLTSEMKRTIVRNIVTARFKEALNDIEVALQQKALDIYERQYPLHIRRKMAELGDGAFNQTRDIDFRCNGFRETIYLPESRSVFATDSYGIGILERDAAVEELFAAKRALENRRADLRQKLHESIRAFNTDKALLKAWPEGKAFIEEVCGKALLENPPAVVVSLQSLIEEA